MAITDYHAMVLGHQLTGRSASKGVDKLAGILAGAQVHLNPHQIDAALFAFQNPLSQGVLLADEVGLGKTIEAGLVISQLWAERERSILVITPATLRKQWYSELDEKFFLPCTILEAKSYNQLRRSGHKYPFDSNNIVICSYQFAKAKAADLQQVPWDLVVMDESHFLRNVYKTSGSTTAKAIKTALAGRRKLLLTATPLQNTLTELFGLVSMIDENVFGDLKSFNDQYARLSKEGSYEDLKQRLKPIAQRTLRRQVTAYVRYTDRKPLVQRFEPYQDEHELYNLVSEYLRRDNLKALPASQVALSRLDPLCMVQYSATFDSPNKVYRLGPIEAHQQKLVKQIEVASVLEELDGNTAYVALEQVDIVKQRALLEINTGSGENVKRKSVWIKQGDDLYLRSGERLEYQEGYRVNSISFDPEQGYVELANGTSVALGQATGIHDDALMRAQVYETVREHLDKEMRLLPQGIKVLSLFFIDRVANYRDYQDDGTVSLGKIGQWFEESYRELTTKYERFRPRAEDNIATIHDGYFSKDKKGHIKDTSGKTAEDDSTYELIMQNKEKLLSIGEPLRFIFSHSALREGWDNPNVFQICTLNETKSVVKKRQEIGRGLRLPVNQSGERIRDQAINRLTVVANESYKDFADQLQREYADEAGIRFGIVPEHAFSTIEIRDSQGNGSAIGQEADSTIRYHLINRGILNMFGEIQPAFQPDQIGFQLDVPQEYEAIQPQITDEIRKYLFEGNQIRNRRDRKHITLNKEVLLNEEFQEFWHSISQRTRYRVRLNSEKLVSDASLRLKELARTISPPQIGISVNVIEQSYAGIRGGQARRTDARDAQITYQIPDVLAYLQNETELTRKTLTRIVIASGMVEKLAVNPQAFLNAAITAIRKTLQDLMLDGITYERLDGRFWYQSLFDLDGEKELTRYLDNLYQVQNAGKTIWDNVVCDSSVEARFAADLDANDQVRFFVKLPAWFRVDTPIGTYNPDWAILLETDREPRLYLIRETKSTPDTDELRLAEKIKIDCGRKHFAAINVDYGVGTSLKQVMQEVQANYRV